MVNIKKSFSVLLVLFFIGCSDVPTIPKMNHHDTIMFEYEGIVYDGVKGWFISPQMWQTLQEALINRRIDANICADISDQVHK